MSPALPRRPARPRPRHVASAGGGTYFLILLSFSAPSNVVFPVSIHFHKVPPPVPPARPLDATASFANKISVGSVTPTEFKLNKIFIKKFPIQRQSSKFESDSAKSSVAFSI